MTPNEIKIIEEHTQSLKENTAAIKSLDLTLSKISLAVIELKDKLGKSPLGGLLAGIFNKK